jgi:hypothetical protein
MVVDAASLTKGVRGSIYGTIYLDYGVGAFPAQGWTDLAVPVCLAWLDSICSLATGEDREREMHFMDGPYQVKAFVTQQGALRLRFIVSRSAGNQVHAEVEVDGGSTLRDALSTADVVLAECRARAWEDDDIRSLMETRELAQTKTRPAPLI